MIFIDIIKIRHVGQSSVITLTKTCMAQMGWVEGDRLLIGAEDGKLILTPENVVQGDE